jgi:hypothetical protein
VANLNGDEFDDALLDDPDALAAADPALRRLAEAGSRVRQEVLASADLITRPSGGWRPRAVVAAGADARLLRAVLEPWCPVPFVAWPGPGLPGWAGALDLVVVLSPGESTAETVSAVSEAVHRGCTLFVACPEHSTLAELSEGRYTTLLPTQTDDALAVAVVVLQLLHGLDLGPEVNPEAVALALDETAMNCSPHRDLAQNPAKDLAVSLADAVPLVWGGSVLAARAGRRVAEALRQASGRATLAADADHLLPVLAAAPQHDVFADPFSDDSPVERRPVLLVLDDGSEAPGVRAARGRLLATAESKDVRSRIISWTEGPEVARYAALLSSGQYAAVYLALGLGRYTSASEPTAR